MWKKILFLAFVSAAALPAAHDSHNAMWLYPEHVDYSIADAIPVFSAADHDVWIKVGKRKDGGLFVALVNLSFDVMPEIQLVVHQIPKKVSVLGKNGQWESVPFEVDGNLLRIRQTMLFYDFAAFKLE